MPPPLLNTPLVNGINLCDIVFVSDIDVFSTCFNFLSMYQVGGLQYRC